MHLFAPSLDRWQGSLGEERHRAQPYCSAAGLIRAFIIIPITQVREPQRDEKDKALGSASIKAGVPWPKWHTG